MSVRRSTVLLLALWLALTIGCGRVGFDPADAEPGSLDGSMDAARAPSLDGGADASAPDAFVRVDAPAPIDASSDTSSVGLDVFSPDAFAADVFSPDAFAADVFSPDAFSPDAFSVDAFSVDAFSLDAFSPDAPAGCGDLRLYYRFDDRGGTVVDSSGCGNAGTATDVAAAEAGRVGFAYRFNRPGVTTARVLVPDSPSLSALTALTIEVWVRHTGGNFQAIVNHGDLMDGDAFVLHTYSSRDPALTLGNHPDCTGGRSFRSSSTLPVDAWVHVAATLDTATDTLIFYVNGVEMFREPTLFAPGPLCDNAEAMLVGAARPDGTWGWQGWIDELRIWGVVRTQAQICVDAGGTPTFGGGCMLL